MLSPAPLTCFTLQLTFSCFVGTIITQDFKWEWSQGWLQKIKFHTLFTNRRVAGVECWCRILCPVVCAFGCQVSLTSCTNRAFLLCTILQLFKKKKQKTKKFLLKVVSTLTTWQLDECGTCCIFFFVLAST